MKKPSKWSLAVVFDLLLVILGITITVISIGYGFGSFRRPGPGLYPVFIGLSITLFSAILFVSEWRARQSIRLFEPGDLRTLLAMLAAFCLWILLMPLLGYVVMTLLSALGFCKIMRLEGWWKPAAISGGTTLFIYLLFDYWLYIDLPRGFLG